MKSTKNTNSKTNSAAVAHMARVNQLATSARKTRQKNAEASPCAVIRALSKSLPKTTRGEFIEVFTAAPFKMSPGTVSRQYYEGRA